MFVMVTALLFAVVPYRSADFLSSVAQLFPAVVFDGPILALQFCSSRDARSRREQAWRIG